MKKRILSMFMALAMMVSLLSVNVAADENRKQSLQNAVEILVKENANKINRSDSADEAFSAFMKHGFFGNGRHMTLKETDPMTAAIFNSALMQDSLIQCLTEAAILMQDMNLDYLYISGGPSWHEFYDTAGYHAFDGTEDVRSCTYGELVNGTALYGSNGFLGETNRNDEAMRLLVGDLNVKIEVIRSAIQNGKASFTFKFAIQDEFDFDSDYDAVKKAGFNTSKDQSLVNLGYLLTFVGLDTFTWSYTTEWTAELPIVCTHEASSYHFQYHADAMQLQVHTEQGFSENESKTLGDSEDGYYFRLSEPIALYHDRPWVIEYTFTDEMRLMLSPSSDIRGGSTYLYHDRNIYAAATVYLKIDSEHPENKMLDSSFLQLSDLFDYRKDHAYICRMENVITDDGCNMVCVSIIDRSLGEILVDKVPMNNHRIRYDSDMILTDLHEKTDLLNGTDLMIRYLGAPSFRLTRDLDLKIWESGTTNVSLFESVHRAPSCTENGGMVHTCRDCNYTYMTELVPALGHLCDEIISAVAPTCTEDGTEAALCKQCGETLVRVIPNTALGHSFGDYVFDNNASCTADGTKTRKCTVCGETETIPAPDTATGHKYKATVTEPTYEQQGYTTYTCAVCGDSYVDDYTDVKQHSYVAVVTEPTCIAQGYTTYTCSECGDSYVDDYTEIVDHTPVIDPYVAPTCVEKGKMEGSHCGVCGLVLKKQALISAVDTHRMEESIVKMPTYDEVGQVAYTCQDCGKTDYMEVPSLTKPTPTNPFTDVAESDWYYEPVLWAVGEGVTGGKTETTFAPNEGCTRAQVVTFLWAANGKPEPKSMDNPFSDVANDAWYLKPVLWAVENGITTGISATEFGPEQTCTRAQIATFLWAAKGKMPANGKSEFVDVADGDWFATPIIWAKENDITGGIGEGKFGPNDTCTRAQVVTFLNKVYNK